MSRVILVEDHPVVRDALRERFARAGWQIAGEAGTFAEARLLLRNVAAEIAIVDWNLPGGSGLALIAAAKGWRPEMGCLLFTAMPSATIVAEAHEAGACGVMCKTTDAARVEIAARAALANADAWTMDEATAEAWRVEPWSAIEREVLRGRAEGLSPAEIGRRVGRSASRVRRVLGFLRRVRGVTGAAEVFEAARQQGVADDAEARQLSRESRAAR